MSPLPLATASARDRLVNAADEALRHDSMDAVSVEAVAQAAGFSRATAFRHLGKRDDMILAVGMQRAAEYARECASAMAGEPTALDQVHAGFQFLVRVLPDDPVMRALMTVRTAADLATDVEDLTSETFGPVVQRGQQSGEIRADVPPEQVMRWIVEQLYLAIQQPDRDGVTVQERARMFLFPALVPSAVASTNSTLTHAHFDGLAKALRDATLAMSALRDELIGPNQCE